MKHSIDLLLMGIVTSTVLVATLSPKTGASFQFSSGVTPAFSESYLLTVAPPPPDPSPDTFQALYKMNRMVVGQYEVRAQDTLQSLAKTYGSTPEYLRSTNRLSSVNLHTGQTLQVHSGKGMLYQVRERKGQTESLKDIAARYNRPVEKIARANNLPGVAVLSDRWLNAGSVLFLPEVRLHFTDYLMPVEWVPGRRLISSRFGMRRHPILKVWRFHAGLDMPRPYGTPVKATREGTVIFTGWRNGYGRLVIVKHRGGICTWYGHLSSIAVTPGQRLKQGQFLGRVGKSGLSTGPHLHFEVRDPFGKSLNPKKFLF